MEKNIYAKYTTFRREKWEKYILSDRKMYEKYICANILRIYKENIFSLYNFSSTIYLKYMTYILNIFCT